MSASAYVKPISTNIAISNKHSAFSPETAFQLLLCQPRKAKISPRARASRILIVMHAKTPSRAPGLILSFLAGFGIFSFGWLLDRLLQYAGVNRSAIAFDY